MCAASREPDAVVGGPLAGQVVLDQRCDSAGVYPFTRAGAGRFNAWARPPSDDAAALAVGLGGLRAYARVVRDR